MNTDLAKLQSYPFAKLNELLTGITPPSELPAIELTIGEPQHEPAALVLQALAANLGGVQKYPATLGSAELRAAICAWLSRQFGINTLDADTQVLPVNGTREALFAIAQTVVKRHSEALVLMPNPFYQIYEGAAFMAGAKPYFYCLDAKGHFDFAQIPAAIWQRCQLIYICSPNNPTGAVMPLAQLQQLQQLARRYDFVIAADECYSDIYPPASGAPPSLLNACIANGDTEFSNCLVFHSLSKRSSLPGMRSGFVAGERGLLANFLKYRTYHGSAMSPVFQAASVVAWQDDAYVQANRELYSAKMTAVLDILNSDWPQPRPEASFYIYARVGAKFANSGREFAKVLYQSQNVKVLPCEFLARDSLDSCGSNLAAEYVRIALVADLPSCEAAARRIVNCVRAQA